MLKKIILICLAVLQTSFILSESWMEYHFRRAKNFPFPHAYNFSEIVTGEQIKLLRYLSAKLNEDQIGVVAKLKEIIKVEPFYDIGYTWSFDEFLTKELSEEEKKCELDRRLKVQSNANTLIAELVCQKAKRSISTIDWLRIAFPKVLIKADKFTYLRNLEIIVYKWLKMEMECAQFKQLILCLNRLQAKGGSAISCVDVNTNVARFQGLGYLFDKQINEYKIG